MSTPPAVPDRGNLRASDADRERVAEVVRQAAGDGRLTMEELDQRLDAVYAARTYAELEPITRDLPQAPGGPASAAVQVPGGDPQRFGGQPSSHGAFAIMGGFSRKGDWVVPEEFTAFAFMGGGELDLREARYAAPTVTIHVFAIMGGVEITVPEDASVRVTGVGVMGAFDHASTGTGAPGGPTIVVNGVAFMSGVEVRRRPLKKPKREKLGSRRPGELELQVAFVDVHHRAVAALPVAEAEALVQAARDEVRLVDTDVHGVRAPAAGLTHGRLHEGPPESLSAPGRGDVQFRQVTLLARAPDRRAEAEHGQAIWSVAGEQDERVTAVEELPDPFCERSRLGRGLVEFPVEGVEQPPDRVGVVTGGEANVVCHEILLSWLRSWSVTGPRGGPRARVRELGQHRTSRS
jgi:hypothetical protein